MNLCRAGVYVNVRDLKTALTGGSFAMKGRILIAGAVAVIAVLMSGDLAACGDKFLMGSRGTRYQRPKNFRAASVLILAEPSAALNRSKIESILKSEGHRSASVQSLEQLSTILAGGRFDVILASNNVAGNVERMIAAAPDRAIVVAVDAKPKDGSILNAIDKAVAQRDKNLKKLHASS